MEHAPLEMAIVGAGFGGLAMARALDRAGRGRFVILEQAAAPGGTWRDNVYPGAACDVPSHLYSLSDAPRCDWTRLFPPQAEIRSYLDALAAPFLADGRLRLRHAVRAAQWDETTATWSLALADGRRLTARALVLAVGGLHQPAWPALPGAERFAGTALHTARWDPAVALEGRRVAVIGTGASAVQLVPAFADRVARLHVMQRTPPWVLPRPERALPPALRTAFRHVPGLRLAFRGALFVLLEILCSGLLHPRSAFWARALARRLRARQIADPALRAALTPDYPIGCKRVLFSSDYYPALQRPHVQLETTPIAQLEPAGIRLADGRLLAIDVLVYATGFRPMDVLRAIDVRGRGDLRLADAWAERARTHLGISVPGFPSLFLLLGPNTALGHNSVLTMIESQVAHVLDALRLRDAHGARAIEPTPDARDAFMALIDRRFADTAWAGGCRSWYLDEHGRNLAIWPGTVLGYRWRTRRARPRDHRLL